MLTTILIILLILLLIGAIGGRGRWGYGPGGLLGLILLIVLILLLLGYPLEREVKLDRPSRAIHHLDANTRMAHAIIRVFVRHSWTTRQTRLRGFHG